MDTGVGILIGLVVGGVLAWVVVSLRLGNRALQESQALQARLGAEEATGRELRAATQVREHELSDLRTTLATERQVRVTAETRLEASLQNIEEQRRLLTSAEARLKDVFAALSAQALRENNTEFVKQAALQMNPLKEALARYEGQFKETNTTTASTFAGMKQLVESVGKTNEGLREQTARLVTALRTPQVRGRWGEITLQRVVEIAGMSPHCDFDLQPSVKSESGSKRPDLVVRLPHGRQIVIDAKAPLNAYLDAVEAADEGTRTDCLRRHADAVRGHMKSLSLKEYWSQFPSTPDFVVMFVPGESFFSAALEQDRDLMEKGFQDKIILATPSTLLALLRTVAHSWQQREVTENAQRIAIAGRELHERIVTFANHLGKIAGGLSDATKAYNAAANSFQSRVTPAGRKMVELSAVRSDAELPELKLVDAMPVGANGSDPSARTGSTSSGD